MTAAQEPSHPLLLSLDEALRGRVAHDPVTVSGEWSTTARKVYSSDRPPGTGPGSYAIVEDVRWRGRITSPVPVALLACLLHGADLYWGKSPLVADVLPLELSFSMYPDRRELGATLSVLAARANLPGVRVEAPTIRPALANDAFTTGQLARLLTVGATAAFVLLLERDAVEMGRKRLWHARDGLLDVLPEALRDLLSRRRSGRVPAA